MTSLETRMSYTHPLRGVSEGAATLDGLPEWNLSDLYDGMSDPDLARDLVRAADDSATFEARWKGKLTEAASKSGDEGLGAAMRDYEALDELMGRIGSYAGLLYSSNTADPAHGKFYGDVQEKLTDASAHVLFFTLELNLVDDQLLEQALANDPAFGHYRPWVADLRKDRPYQLEDRVEQLFHEKSVTGRAAWN